MKIQNKKLAIWGAILIFLSLGPFSEGEFGAFLLFAAAGGILIYKSKEPPKPKKNKKAAAKPSEFEFPDFDSTGRKRLAIVETILSGITHEHFGSNPQDVIPLLEVGEQLLLHPDPDNQYDQTAVWVSTTDGAFIGWIPAGSNADVFKRLIENQTVYARVKYTELIGVNEYSDSFEDEIQNAPIGLVIEIARYSKAVPK